MKSFDEKFFRTIRNFLEIYLPKQRKFSENTKKSYRESLNLLLRFIQEKNKVALKNISFSDFNSNSIREFMLWLKDVRHCSGATVNQRLMAMKSFAKYCCISNPSLLSLQVDIGNIEMQKTEAKTVNFMSEQGVQCLLEQPDKNKFIGFRNFIFILLMYDLAARCQEMLDIRLADISFCNSHGATIFICGKGSKTRRLPISENVVPHLKKYIELAHGNSQQNDWLFFTTMTRCRKQMSPDAVGLFLKQYGNMAREQCPEMPKRIYPHLLRHSRAMHLYRNGLNLVLLAEFMGHAHIDTTQIYAWSDTETKRKAIQRLPHIANSKQTEPVWQNDENLIKKLYGLG